MIAAQQSTKAEKLQGSHLAAEVNRRPKRLPRLHQQHRQEGALLEVAADSLDQDKDFAPQWHLDHRNRLRRLAGAALA